MYIIYYLPKQITPLNNNSITPHCGRQVVNNSMGAKEELGSIRGPSTAALELKRSRQKRGRVEEIEPKIEAGRGV